MVAERERQREREGQGRICEIVQFVAKPTARARDPEERMRSKSVFLLGGRSARVFFLVVGLTVQIGR